jgi:hypothetical protein
VVLDGRAPVCVADPMVDRVHALAAEGELARAIVAVHGPARAELVGAVYAVVWPVVYQRLTRQLERQRGHGACLTGVAAMAPDCLDRFHDDVEAVIDDVTAHADKPIHSLEAWVASRLTAATVDAHRRRRGATGALQRPRLPQWLTAELREAAANTAELREAAANTAELRHAAGRGGDEWLAELAVQILIWVGIPMTAGLGLWPLDQWSHRRAMRTGDWYAGPTRVERDIECVLRAMRTRPVWFADHVEKPLGHKVCPVAPMLTDESGRLVEAPPLRLTGPDDEQDTALLDLAAAAIDVIDARLQRGEVADQAVPAVLGTLFGAGEWDAAHDHRLTELLSDGEEMHRVVTAVMEIIRCPQAV